MPRQRPAPIVVVAVLNLVLGGLGLFCTVCSGITSLAGGPPAVTGGTLEQQRRAQADRQRTEVTRKIVKKRAPFHPAWLVLDQGASALFSLALIVSGIGLLSMQSWARWLAVGYAALRIPASLVEFIYYIVITMPAEAEAFRVVPPQNDTEQAVYKLAQIVAPGVPCLAVVYPAVVLLLLFLPSVSQAFRKEARRGRKRRRPDDYDEYDDYRPVR
jgi:uncharacterized membrane protein (DUF2068 family)